MLCNKRTNVDYGNPIISAIAFNKAQAKIYDSIKHAKPRIDCSPPNQPISLQNGKDFNFRKRQATQNAVEDLKMIKTIANTMNRPPMVIERKGPPSLNKDGRRKMLDKINRENLQLYEKLNNLKPVYGAKMLEAEYKKNQKYMINSSFTFRRQLNQKHQELK
jgi:Hemingway/CFA97